MPAYITRRFDILHDGSKLPLEDFASLIGRSEQTTGLQFKYYGCYEDIAKAIRANVAAFPEGAKQLVDHIFLSDKLKRNYVRTVNERISRFNRVSER